MDPIRYSESITTFSQQGKKSPIAVLCPGGRWQRSFGVFWGLSDTIGSIFLGVFTDYEICNRWLGEYCVCIDLIIYCVTDKLGNFIVFDSLLENEIYKRFGKK